MSDDTIGSCVTLSKLFLSVRFYSKVRISKGDTSIGIECGHVCGYSWNSSGAQQCGCFCGCSYDIITAVISFFRNLENCLEDQGSHAPRDLYGPFFIAFQNSPSHFCFPFSRSRKFPDVHPPPGFAASTRKDHGGKTQQ